MKILRVTRVILAIIVIILCTYAFVVNEFGMMPYIQLAVITFTFITGIIEFQEKRKGMGILMFLITGLFIVFWYVL